MARLHLGALEFSEADSGYPQPHWHESRLLREDMESLGARLSPAIRRNVADIIDELRHEPMTPDSYGLIHREVSINNRHLEEGRAWIFDFGNCECGYFLQDLATVLYDSIDCWRDKLGVGG